MLVEAPAPDFIGDEFFANNEVRLYDVEESAIVPTAYYKYDWLRLGFVKV